MKLFRFFGARLTAATALVAGLTGLVALPAAAQKPAYTLTILHNNDGESKIAAAGTGALANYGGIARFATVARNLRNQALAGTRKNDVVLLSSGDNFLAGTSFNASLTLPANSPYYDSIGLRLIGYDALAIGNHEFDFGPDVLAKFINGFNGTTKFVSANLDFSAEANLQSLVNSGVIVKSTVLTKRGGQRIGIVGATTPLLPFISSPRGVVADPNYAAAIQTEVDRLTAQGVRIIILISHLQSVNEDRALAPLLRNVDVLIAGGGDELLSNPGNLLVPGDVATALTYPLLENDANGRQVPIITTAGDYKYVGRLVVNFDGRGQVQSVSPMSGPVRVSGNPADADRVTPASDVQTQVVDPVLAYEAGLAANIIGTSNVALEGRRGTGNANPASVVPGIRTTETNIGNLLTDALLFKARQLAGSFGQPLPTIAIQNGGGIRNNTLIPAGNISEKTTFDIAAFSNFVTIIPTLTPAQLKEVLENAVSRVTFADGRFAQISGFVFTYDEDLPARLLDGGGNVTQQGQRVRTVQLLDGVGGTPGTFLVQNGVVVPGAPSVTVATIDFLVRPVAPGSGLAGDQYPTGGLTFVTLGVTYQKALFDYISLPSGLNGSITAADYPAGGEGRITRLN